MTIYTVVCSFTVCYACVNNIANVRPPKVVAPKQGGAWGKSPSCPPVDSSAKN